MKTKLTLIAIVLMAGLNTFAQEYKVAKSSGQLNLNIQGAIVEGYDGKEIIYSGQKNADEKVDERAKGLVSISGSGLIDNTGLGINVTENGQEVNVSSLTRNRRANGVLTIKVPKNMKVSFKNNNNYFNETVIFKGLTGELEISTSYNDIKLENNTGPMNVKTVYGGVDATFKEPVKGPISIISVYKHVDVTLPKDVKANVELASSSGNLYAAKEFNIAVDKTEQPNVSAKVENVLSKLSTNSSDVMIVSGGQSFNGATSISGSGFTSVYGNTGDRIKGTINGGGVSLIFKSTYKSVYLRQQ